MILPPPLLDVQDMTFAYGARTLFEAVTFSIAAGEVVCLLGPNGAGKSTLVKILTGSLRPGSGRVLVDGAEDASRDVGLVPQEIALYPWLTAEENCFAFARLAGVGARMAAMRVARAIDITGCIDVAHTPIRRLSGGYKRRVNIAAALVAAPRVLILDEPTVGIDLDARQQIAEIVRRLKDSGSAILLVTHDFAEADALADRAAFLVGGTLVAFDRPDALVRQLFQGRKSIDIILRQEADVRTATVLAECGARPTGDETVWQAFRAIEGWNIGPFAASLASRHVDFMELRLRDPGLETVYARLCIGDRHGGDRRANDRPSA